MIIIKKLSNEEKVLDIINILKEDLKKKYEKGDTKRSVHTKSICLLKARFKVIDEIDKDLKIGVFKEPREYKALIRISNSSGKPKPDSKKDVRGFAIKLLGVDGEKVNEDEKYTQDFVCLSVEEMPLGTLDLFHKTIYYNVKLKNPLLYLGKMAMDGDLNKLIELSKCRKNQSSLLDIPYFSTTPYKYENKIVKYAIKPTSKYKSQMPSKLTDTYLVDNMKEHLKDNEATFDFYIQIKKDNMPLNDASVHWDKNISPYIKVAEIIIEKQEFLTEERKRLSEQLSYSPGHSLICHRPTGELNEARMDIYNELSKFRHYRNDRELIEPTIEYFDKLK